MQVEIINFFSETKGYGMMNNKFTCVCSDYRNDNVLKENEIEFSNCL